MISDKVYELCRNPQSVSSELARNPTEATSKIAKQLYGHLEAPPSAKDFDIPAEHTSADLNRAFECGNWGPQKPSELFLKVPLP
jgi:hypothetical protein